ncbi:MAG: sigma-54-dependent Fis family transcriptional regulator [Bacteroidales bacterium]|nr:sigma-54-dependent Fis family transcriptional regulator [Bacteroidales bacterium]MBN2757588.1 sigma-54-dependent Fis family transcriptional regulator [Bacteroidales bacterium]
MGTKTGKILAVDDNTDVLFALKLLLKQQFAEIHTEENPENIPKLVKQEDYDVILLDMNFSKDAISGKEGFYWLDRILEIDPSAIVIFITAYGDVENAVRAIKMGAIDFVNKPWQNEKLVATISAGLKLRQSRLEVDSLREKQSGLKAILEQPFGDFIGISPSMQKVFETIKKVSETDASILILGENGTGKELVARSLHKNSARKNEVLVSVDLGSLTETLFESELFGHVKGAYTDAKGERPGRFEIASGGTLFLDEIGNLSLPLQSKLLTVLERREVTRLGSNKPRAIDIRLICATNMPILQMIKEEKFREDLLYRINTVEIHIPPLRDRIEDIPVLANHFLKIYSKKYKKNIKEISSATIKKLQQYNWPGNVRELQHSLERAIIMSDTNILQPFDFHLTSSTSKVDEVELENYNLEEVEKIIILKVLKKHGGNISNAAKELGLTRTSLYRRMEKHDL